MSHLHQMLVAIAEDHGVTAHCEVSTTRPLHPSVVASFSDEHDLYPVRGQSSERVWLIDSVSRPGWKILTVTGGRHDGYAPLAAQLLEVLDNPRVAL